LLAGEVVELVGGLDGLTERKITGKTTSSRWSAMMSAP